MAEQTRSGAGERPRIEYDSIERLSSLLAEAGCRRIFLVTGGSGRLLEPLRRILSDFELRVFSEAKRHVPLDVVERARQALASAPADAVVSAGGGSATGLGKALRLDHSFYFAAVPTTYAGSELTDLYGITSADGKRTGRDPRVIPDLVLYDVEATLHMPLALSVTSLLNALAHPLGALSTGQLDAEQARSAVAAGRRVHDAIVGLLTEPSQRERRRAAFAAAVESAEVLRRYPVGTHHRLAHALGGRFDLDHAGLHSVLLPHSLVWMATRAPELYALIEAELGGHLPERLLDFMRRAGAPASLAELGVGREAFERFVASDPALPAGLLRSAFAGRLTDGV